MSHMSSGRRVVIRKIHLYALTAFVAGGFAALADAHNWSASMTVGFGALALLIYVPSVLVPSLVLDYSRPTSREGSELTTARAQFGAEGAPPLGGLERPGMHQLRVVIPRTFGDAQEVADASKGYIPVLMDLRYADSELARRLRDFALGLTYATGATAEPFAKSDLLQLIAPPERDQLAEEEATSALRLVLPKAFDEAPEVAEAFRKSQNVMVNLQATEVDVSKRIIDFMSGLAYGRDAALQRVAERVFLLTSPGRAVPSADVQKALRNSGIEATGEPEEWPRLRLIS